MDMTIRAATPAERLYAYEQSARIDGQCGSPGYLFGELDSTLSVCFPNWTRNDSAKDTPEFRAEFNAVLDMLRSNARYGNVLQNRALMNVYCLNHTEARCNRGWDYVFRADTKDYSYLLRCTPDSEDEIHFNIHPYRRECLDRHMGQAEKGISFITTDFKGRFKIPDDDMVRITRPGGGYTDKMCRYVDDYHMEVGGSFYSIYEFAGMIEQSGGSVIPLRSSFTVGIPCLNCEEETAAYQFIETKKLWQRISGRDKMGGRVCFHGYQSFKANEVTAEIAHEIGVRLAQELWGDRFEVVVATHCNTGHYHNHFVLNSVSFADGLKFDNTPADYARMREVSDRLCREYAISVIENPGGRAKSYGE